MATNYSPAIVTDGAVFVGDARTLSTATAGSRLYDKAGVDSTDVKLLIHGNVGSGQSFADSSLSNHTVTASGNVTHSTTESKFSGGSIYFDGAGDNLTIPASGDWDVGTGDWTFECWAYTVTTSGAGYFFDTRSASYTGNFSLYRSGTSLVYYAQSTSMIIVSTAFALNTWHHIAVVRSGSTVTLYVDGTSIGSATDANDYQGLAPFTIGARYTSENYWYGYQDEFRFTKGISLWTQDFTPPARRDTLSISDGMMYNGSCLNFDGTDEYVLTSGYFGALAGDDDVTLCAWINVDTSGDMGVVSIGNVFMSIIVNGGYLEARCYNSGSQLTNTDAHKITPNQWCHVAGVFSGGNVTLYKDGVATAAVACSNQSLAAASAYFQIGKGYTSGYLWMDGEIASPMAFDTALSASQIKEIYQDSKVIIPSNVSQTNLRGWWTFADGAGTICYDGSGRGIHGTFQNMEAADWSTGQTGCPQLVEGYNRPMLFDGSNDYVNCGTDTSLLDLSGTITVAAWVYWAGSTGEEVIYSVGNGETQGTLIQTRSATTLRMMHNTGSVYYGFDAGTGWSADTWHHVALTFTGSMLYGYIDGSSFANTAVTTTLARNSSNPAKIGTASWTTGRFWPGIINEVLVYNTALALADIQALAATGPNGGALPPDPTTLSTSGNIVSYWRNDGDVTWADRVGSNTGTVTGSPDALLFKQGYNGSASTSTGRDGQGFPLLTENIGAIGFGGSDYVSIAGLPALTTKTVAFWAQVGAGVFVGNTDNIVVSWGSGWTGLDMVDDGATASLRFHTSAGSNPGAARITGLEMNQWYYLAYTEDGTTNKYYKNGSFVASTTAGTITSATTIALGARTSLDYNYSGAVSGLQLYNRALSESELLQNFNAQKSRFT
jgi:hypothetical protein